MRTIALAAAAALTVLPAGIARACGAVACLPAAVAVPAYTPEGLRIGTVVARVARPLPLEPSRFTGQPLTVVYNDPGLLPGSVDPGLALVPLPRVRRFDTRAVYPRGY